MLYIVWRWRQDRIECHISENSLTKRWFEVWDGKYPRLLHGGSADYCLYSCADTAKRFINLRKLPRSI